ncbi:MAG: outer membrane beta-barrel protein [Bacteroidales bacterium]|nr:outer membrane beta-barrel protein [Bacteroidales bacterium]MDD6731240.1 outer membrane beta-barrel protein [Bacteroidales bacterium]
MKRLLLLLLPLFALTASAQNDETVYRLELGGGIGLGTGHTDLKGKWAANVAAIARFPLNPRMAVKTQLSYLNLKGSTDGLKNFYPAQPDAAGTERLQYSVSDAVIDVSALYELHFLPYGYQRDYKGHCRLVPYLQMGFGLTYGKAGKAFTANIPLGVGVKYKVAERLNLGLDWLVHFTLSDKLDGLEAPLGISSSGFRNKDHYSALSLTLTYDLNPRCPTCNRD